MTHSEETILPEAGGDRGFIGSTVERQLLADDYYIVSRPVFTAHDR